MHKTLFASLAFALAACASPAPSAPASAQAPALAIEPYTFTARDGTTVEAERGTFEVPENRADPSSRRIKLSFVRFPSTSTAPGAPIVYLAGGPGGSGEGTATGPRFPLFMALREVADVIAFDQRGTGKSNDIPFCADEAPQTGDLDVTRDALVAYYREQLPRCFAWWESEGIDIDGYTTLESAHDLEDLRRALGAEKIDLWGISYGSHLALAALKHHPDSIGRAVLAGIEGLDQTVKRPALTDALFAYAQTLIDADPKAKAFYPDLAAMMRRAHERLNAEPARVTFTPQGAAAPVTLVYDAFALQLLAGGMIADPQGLAQLPSFYLAADAGQDEVAANYIHGAFFSGPSGFRGMPEAMDLASGISPARLKLVRKEAETSLLADALNFPMPQIAGLRPEIDLGEDFRAPFKSSVPVLFISGTLDGRTYPEEAEDEIKGFANAARLIVENGGHNIYEADPRVAEAVIAYFKGEPAPARIRFEPPVFATP
ncbi:MAG: alpha/beta fold hydrolase [Amphiplicatus sp.]